MPEIARISKSNHIASESIFCINISLFLFYNATDSSNTDNGQGPSHVSIPPNHTNNQDEVTLDGILNLLI